MAYTLPQLEQAMVNAHNAGDTNAARKLAAVVKRERDRLANRSPSDVMVDDIESSVETRPVQETVPEQQSPTMAQRVEGAAETAITMGSALTSGLLGQIEGTVEGIVREIASGEFGSYEAADRIEELAMKRAQQLTLVPQTETGAQYTQAVGEVLEPLAALPPTAEFMAAANVMAAPGARQAVAQATREAVTPVAQQTQQVASEIVKRVRDRIPQLPSRQPAVVADQSMGAAAVDQAALRQARANELPVPITLTEGQKTRAFEAQRFERETAKMSEQGAPIRERFEEQNRQLQQNLDEFIDMTGSEVTDLRGVGELVDQALRNRAARDKVKIRTLYKEAEKAGEMEQPVNMQSLVDFLNESVSSESTAPILGVVKKELARLGGATIGKDGLVSIGAKQTKKVGDKFTGALKQVETGGNQSLTLNQAEQLRKVINKNAGSDATNIKFASELKQVIDGITEGKGGDKYRQARAARARYAKDYENVGIVDRLLNTKRGSDDRAIALEDVVRKTMLDPSTSLDNLRQVRRLLQTKTGPEGQQAWRELQGATLRHIQDQALKGVTTNQRGDRVVSPAQLDRVINQLDKSGKLDFIFGKKGAEQLRTINEVAKDILTAPPGTVNTSNTATVLAGLMDVVLAGSTGIPAPIASGFNFMTKQIRDSKLKARVRKTLGDQGS